jgi:hypothetical protein
MWSNNRIETWKMSGDKMLAQKALRHLYLGLRSNSTWGSSDSTGLEHRNSIRYESSPFNSQRSLTLGYRFSDNGLNYEMYELSAYWNMHTNETQGNSKKNMRKWHTSIENIFEKQNNLPILKLTSERELKSFKMVARNLINKKSLNF